MRTEPSSPSNRPPIHARPATPAVNEPSRAATPGATERKAPSAGLLERVRAALTSAATFVEQWREPFGTWHNPDAVAPADTGGLRVGSYNIYVKGKHLAQIERDLREQDLDVVCLQETSRESAETLARNLGMHVAYHVNPLHAYGGNAILSKHPIVDAAETPFENPFIDRWRATWSRLKQGDPRMSAFDQRSILRATLRVGDRTVDVLDMHLMLFGNVSNTQNLRQVTAYVKARETLGHTVVLGGDLNTNFAMATGERATDAKGRFDTPTDTLQEYRDRQGVGDTNIRDVDNREAAERLAAGMNYFWDAPTRTVLVEGQMMTPAQALAELQSGQVPPDSDRHKQLLLAADGSTVLGAAKRFDNLMTSKDARIVSAHIDQTTRGSDHQPVYAEIRWD